MEKFLNLLGIICFGATVYVVLDGIRGIEDTLDEHQRRIDAQYDVILKQAHDLEKAKKAIAYFENSFI